MRKAINAGDAAQRKTLGRIEEDKQTRLVDAWRWLLADPRGRLLLFAIVEGPCEMNTVSLATNSEIYRHEGKRSVGADIIQQAQAVSPRAWTLAVHERASEKLAEIEAEEAAVVAATFNEEDTNG